MTKRLRIRATDTTTGLDATSEEMLGDAIFARYHPDNRATAEAHAAELMEDRADFDIPDTIVYTVEDED